MYKSFVLPTMKYASIVWGGIHYIDIQKLERIHVDAMRLVTGATARSNIANHYTETCWQSISECHKYSVAVMLYKIRSHRAPEYLQYLLPQENVDHQHYNLRN